MVKEELKRIEDIYQRAMSLLDEGKLKQALQLSAKLNGSWARSEASRAQTIIEASVLQARRKPTRAKKRCLADICYLWDDPWALCCIRSPHPLPDEHSRWFELLVQGGVACLGMFMFFSEEHYCRFLVLANDTKEALGYVDELANFQLPDSCRIVESVLEPLRPDQEVDRRGVYRCSAFTIDSLPDTFLAQAENALCA